jgi:Flp pilus assembly protein TadG
MRRLRQRRGFVVITTAVCLIVFFALIGLAVDAGRLYVAHDELQTFVDEAAVAASFELDGTSAGIARAQSVAAAGPGSGTSVNHWYFGTQTVTSATVQFSTAPGGPFVSSPVSAAGYRFVQVQVTTPIEMYFLPVLQTPGAFQNISVSAIAGQSRTGSLGDGLEPFSPIAHLTSSVNFGFTVGQQYTLRWPPPGKQGKEGCPGDAGFTPPNSNWRGYIDVGQGNGNSGLRDAIVNNSYSLPSPLVVGSVIDEVNGQKSVTGSIDERFNQDTDTSSSTYSTYHGNGRRLLTVAVNDGGSPAKVVGFGLFLLDPSPCGSGGNTTPCCAEYVGAAVIGSTHAGGGAPPDIYRVQLVK